MFMKTISHFLLTLFVCLWLVGCSDEEHIEPSISLSGPSSLTFETSGGSQTVSFTSVKPWTASVNQGWCKISSMSGNGGTGSISIMVDENTTFDERNTSLIILSESVSKTVSITQKQKDALTVTSNKVEVNAEGGTARIEVKANVNYTYEIEKSAQEWISTSSSRALTSSTIELKVQPNEELEKREGKVIVRSGEMEEIVTIYQSGAFPTIVLTQNEYTVGSGEENLTIQLRSNVDYQMIMPDGVSWIQIVESRAMSDYTHCLKVSANDTYSLRSAEVHFVNEVKEVSEMVKIIQVQNDAIVVAQNEYVLDAITTELGFEVNSNVKFEVSATVDWIHFSTESRALIAYPLSFVVDENKTPNTREGVISLKCRDLKQEIKVIQRGRVDKGRLLVIHTNWNFVVPKIAGHYVNGQVIWGDNICEDYHMDLNHIYEQEKTYTLVLDLWGVEEVEFQDLVGIKEIDFSEL